MKKINNPLCDLKEPFSFEALLNNTVSTKLLFFSHHDDFNPLGHRIGLVVLLLSQHTGKVAQLPDWTSLATLPGQLRRDKHEDAQGSAASRKPYRTLPGRDGHPFDSDSVSDTSCEESTPRCISVGVCEVDVAHPHLQDEGHARREEGHEDKVIGQDGHAAETTHDLQLGHAWKTTAEVMGVILPLSTPPRRSVRKEKRSPDTVPTPMTRHSTTASRVKVGPRMAMPSEMFSLTSSCTQDTRPPHPSPFLSINTQLNVVCEGVCVCVCYLRV